MSNKFIFDVRRGKGENVAQETFSPEELTAMENHRRRLEMEERSRPLTETEVLRLLLRQQINALTVDDHTALRMTNYYPEWTANTQYPAGFKVRWDGRLWRVLQAHTSQTGWEPEYAASLWTRINESHSGTVDDPIPYKGNMALENGKCYVQDYEVFRCIRDTGNPVYHPLRELLGLYVEEAM